MELSRGDNFLHPFIDPKQRQNLFKYQKDQVSQYFDKDLEDLQFSVFSFSGKGRDPGKINRS